MEVIKKLRWLITGGDSQLGRTLVNELNLAGIENISLTRLQFDVTNKLQVKNVILQLRPDVIVNTAALTDVDRAESMSESAFKINAEAPKLLASASKTVDARFIQISTDYVFSGEMNVPWDENSMTCPISVYGASKAAGEISVMSEYPDRSFIVRTAWLYSQYGNNFVKRILTRSNEERNTLQIIDDRIGQPTSAVDLSRHLIKMMQQNVASGIYHGTNNGQASWYEFACEIFTLIGEDPKRITAVKSDQLKELAFRPIYSVLGHEKWSREGMEVMQPWRLALSSALPNIRESIKQER